MGDKLRGGTTIGGNLTWHAGNFNLGTVPLAASTATVDSIVFPTGTSLTGLSTSYTKVKWDSTGYGGLAFYDGNDTLHGYVYGDSAGASFGLLSGVGEWAVRIAPNGAVQLRYDNSEKLATSSTGITVTGETLTGTLKSTAATGTAPFIVASTTNVTNLNADMLDGYHQTSFARLGDTTPTSGYLYLSRDSSASPLYVQQKGTGPLARFFNNATAGATTGPGMLEIQNNGTVNLGDGTTDSRLVIKRLDSATSDDIQFYNGTTRMGEIGTQDTTWLRINQETAKNIYTPRYFRADGGLYVNSTSYGINGSGLLLTGSFSGTYGNALTFSNANNAFTGSLNSYTTSTTDTTNTIAVRTNQGQLTCSSLITSAITGTQPFSIISTTKVDNLNADMLDGLQGSDVVRLTGSVAQTVTGVKSFASPIKITAQGVTTDIGSLNTSWCHMNTTATAGFYSYRPISVGGTTTMNATNVTTPQVISPKLSVGSMTLNESTHRAGMLRVSDTTTSWSGVMLGNATEDLWSLMADGNGFGVYNDSSNEWHVYCTDNGSVKLYYNGATKLETNATGVGIVGDFSLTGRIKGDVYADNNAINFDASNNFTLTATAANITVAVAPAAGQSGTIRINSAENITGWGTEFYFQNTPTGLSGTEVFAYFAETTGIIRIGRVQ